MLGLGLSLQKGISAFNAGRALVSSYIRRVTEAGGVLQNTACDAAAINELNQDRLLEPASWVLVPDGIKEDVIYAQKPSSGLGDLTMTRASDATYTDAGGVVRRSPYNLLTFSEQFNDGSWFKTAAVVTTDVITAPNGTLTAEKVVATATTGNHFVSKSSVALTGEFTLSIFAKASEYSKVKLQDVNAGRFNCTYDLSDSTTIGAGAAIQNVGDGWFRCSVAFTSSGSGVAIAVIGSPSTSISYTGDGTSGIFIWGAQLVEGTSALDYFPTTNRQDVPRIDFRNADGTLSSCGRLLLEPQRTNFVLRSEEFDSATWTKSLTTVVANAEISPDGTQDAETMTVSTSASFVEQTVALTAGTYTFSVYVKVISQTTAGQMRLQAVVDGVGLSVNFTPTTQWQRFTSTYTAGATLTNVRVRGQTFVGTVAVWGAQLETGAYPTTYIPTTTAAVTRIADVANKTGVSSLIGQTEGTIYLEILNNGNNSIEVPIVINNNLNQLELQLVRSSAYQYRLSLYNAGVFVTDIMSTPVAPFGLNKLAIGYKSGDYALSLNGALLTNNNTSKTYTSLLDKLSIGGTNTNNTAQAALFPTRLSNSQLQSLTTL